MTKIAEFNRTNLQLLIWDSEELIASYWGVIGLKKNTNGRRYNIKARYSDSKNHIIGSFPIEIYLQERWE